MTEAPAHYASRAIAHARGLASRATRRYRGALSGRADMPGTFAARVVAANRTATRAIRTKEVPQMGFDEIIELLQGEEPDIAGIIDGLGGLRTASEGANARIAELEQAVADMEAKYQQTAAKNWELMQAMTAEPEPEPESDEDEGEGDPFADLFEEGE